MAFRKRGRLKNVRLLLILDPCGGGAAGSLQGTRTDMPQQSAGDAAQASHAIVFHLGAGHLLQRTELVKAPRSQGQGRTTGPRQAESVRQMDKCGEYRTVCSVQFPQDENREREHRDLHKDLPPPNGPKRENRNKYLIINTLYGQPASTCFNFLGNNLLEHSNIHSIQSSSQPTST